jgi:hypothetical protein
MGANSN